MAHDTQQHQTPAATDENNEGSSDAFSNIHKTDVVLKDNRFADSLLVRSARAVVHLIKKTTGALLSSTNEEQAASREKSEEKQR